MDALRYLFKPTTQVARELSTLSEADRVETVRKMLVFSRSTYELAKAIMPMLGLDNRMDLLELACRSEPSFESHIRARKIAATFANRGPALTGPAMEALKTMNVPRESYAAFMRGEAVPCGLLTRTGRMTNGFLALKEDCLASGIVVVHDPGDGLHALGDYRERSMELAAALGKDELELIGASISNERLGRLLVRQGFVLSTVEIPPIYGGGEMEILSKRFMVRR